jgi:hypothetical protein
MVRKPYDVQRRRINASRQKGNDDGKGDRKECARLHLQLHQGRLPLQSLHLQELRLLI